MPAGRGNSLIRPALVGLALACIATGFWRFCGFMRHGGITNDWPWLYRTGLEIWQYGLPARDTLSWTYPERAWTLYQWLFEAVAAPIYAGLGATASVFVLCLFGFALYAAVPAWVLARRGVQPWLTLAVGSVVLVPVGLNFSLRPMLATLVLLAVQWVWLERWRAGRLRFAVAAGGLAIGYALWSNLHLGFTLGLASLALFALVDLCAARGPALMHQLAARLFVWAGFAMIAGAGTGLNPYGWGLYGYIWELSHKSAMNAHIRELMPPDPSQPAIQLAIGLGAALVVLCGLAVWRRVALPWTALLHVALFTAMTSQAIRMVVWAGLAYVWATAPLVQTLADSYRDPTRTAARRAPSWRALGGLTVLALVIAGPASAWSWGAARVADCGESAHAIEVLDDTLPAEARWFSSERVGSCVALVAPGRRVFIDTRFDFYPESFVLAWFMAYQHRRNWQGLFKRWHIDHALLADTAPLVPVLEQAPNFSRRRIDDRMLLFSRR